VENQKCWKETREDVGFGPVRTELMITMKSLFARHRIGHNLPDDEPAVKLTAPSTDPFNGDDQKIRMFTVGPPTPAAVGVAGTAAGLMINNPNDNIMSKTLQSPISMGGSGSGATTPSAPSSGAVAMKKSLMNDHNNNNIMMMDDEAAAEAAAASYQMAIQGPALIHRHIRHDSNGNGIPTNNNDAPTATGGSNGGMVSLRIDSDGMVSSPVVSSLPTSKNVAAPPSMSLPDRGPVVAFGAPTSASATGNSNASASSVGILSLHVYVSLLSTLSFII
jgi:hypothetical protein